MPDLRLFEFDGRPVRTLPATDERPELFAAVDLCTLLDHKNVSEAVTTHLDPDEWVRVDAVSAGRADSRFDLGVPGRGAQSLLMVTEPGAWALVFGSRAPGARAVRRWLRHDVLPALRSRGAYALPDVNAHLLATLLAARTALDVQGESDTRHAERVLLQDGPLDADERDRQLREVAALDATRRLLSVELERWSAALPPDTPIPLPAAVVALAEHLRVTTRRGGRRAPQLPQHVAVVDA